LRPLQFRWIEVFRAVALGGTTTSAAELLNLDQSAVSRHISALEGQLGLRLFDRSQRKLRLTQEGKTLLGEACNTLDGLDRFRRVADEIRQMKRGHLHILAGANLANGLLPEAIAAFRDEAPTITLSIDVIARREVAAKMESQQFDLAIIALPFAYPDEGLIASRDYRGVCILPKHHALADKRIVRLSDLANVDLVGLPNGTVGRMQIDRYFSAVGLGYDPVLETSSAVAGFVAAGLGAAIVDPFTARTVDLSKVAVRPLEPSIAYGYGMFLPVDRIPSAVSKRFTEIVVATARSLDDSSGTN
jgi:DNA-binding transcriptional LysR family regulator